MSVPQVVTIAAIGWLGYQFLGRKKKRKKKDDTSDLPSLDCAPYVWKAVEVEAAMDGPLAAGERDPETLALMVAKEVYPTKPDGSAQQWPSESNDTQATCILDRIRMRVNARLFELDEDEDEPSGDDDDGPTPKPPPHLPPFPIPPFPVPPPGPTDDPPLKPPTLPEEPPPVGGDDPEEPEDPGEWPDYPPPAPVDLGEWTDPKNYPTPGMFHKVGGQNSASALQVIARKALTTAFYLTFGDLDLAIELAGRSENWRAYREAIECCPWNHALFGSASQPGTSGHYETPHGDQISMFPAHANVASLLANGDPPQRRVRTDNQKLPAGGHHAFIWLPPLDEAELAEGRVKIKHEHWWTGDWVIMPPPEVLALGVVDVPPGRTWGCGGYETSYDYDEE